MPTALELERILAQDDWIRRLARRLVRDRDLADDLAQDAWVAALESGRDGTAPRRWLGGVLRNVKRQMRRSAGRRQAREAAAARDEATPSAGRLVEELTLRREVAAALLALEEPYRGALYLRFFQDSSLAAIAREQGVAVSTVHERVQRGLQLLRLRLDRACGERSAWAMALLPLAQPSGFAVTVLGGIVMGSGVKLAAAGLVIAGGAVAWWLRPQGPEGSGVAVGGSAVAPLAVAQDAPPTAPVRPLERGAERAAVTPLAEATPAAPPVALVHGRVVDTGARPVGAVAVGYVDAQRQPRALPSTLTASDGSFALAAPSGPAAEAIGCLDERFTTLVAGAEAPGGERLVVVAPAVACGGRAVDGAGLGVAGASVSFQLRQELFGALGIEPPREPRSAAWSTRSSASGDFELARVAGGDGVGLEVSAPGYVTARVDLPPGGARDLIVVLEADSERVEIFGTVLDPDGRPLAGAGVATGREIVLSGPDGGFRLSWDRGQDLEAYSDRPARIVESHVIASKAGFLPARMELVANYGRALIDVSEPIVLQLGSTPLSIAGRVVDPDGKALEGIVVWATDPTPFGLELIAGSGGSTGHLLTLEESVRGGRDRQGVVSDADGRFELGGLLARDYELAASDPRTATRGGPWTIAAGEDAARLVLAPEPDTTRVAGRIVSLGGAPVTGVLVTPRRGMPRTVHDDPPYSAARLSTRTDEDGRFEFPALATRGTRLQLDHVRLMIMRSVALEGREDLGELELVEPVLGELQVELGDPGLADEVQVLAPDGVALLIFESHGPYLSQFPLSKLTDGRTGVLRVQENGNTLVLRKDGQEVLRRPLQLDPDARTTIRL